MIPRDLIFLAYAVSANLAFLGLAAWVLAEFVGTDGIGMPLWLLATIGCSHWFNQRWVMPLA